MRAVSGFTAIALIAALAACSPKAADDTKTDAAAPASPLGALTEADMPKPKLGKWKMTIAIPGLPQPQVAEVCYTQAMIDELKDAKVPGAECATADLSRDGAAYVTKLRCTVQGKASLTTIRAEGDFNSRYTSTMTNVSEPPAATDMPPVTTTAEYLGPCP